MLDKFRDHATADASFSWGHVFARLAAEMPAAQALRTELHRHPDLSGAEARTLDTLLAHLPEAADRTRLPGHAGLIRIGPPGPAVAIRAEMDALPIVENTGVEWASTNGAMHACGHDVHMAAFVAVARAIDSLPEPPVPLVGLLQPREETSPSGALEFVNSTVLHDHRIAAIIGAHVQPALKSTAVACSSGVVNAASDEFFVTIHGSPAHGAYPHNSRDPLLAASNFVVTCQQIVSRNSDPIDSAVVSIGSIRAGTAPNAIPDEATVSGMVRTMSAGQRTMIQKRIREVADGIALAHGCTAEVTIYPGEPPLQNNTALARAAARILQDTGNEITEFRSYGADDFAFYAEVAPSLMIFVGTPESRGHGLHASGYLPDDGALWRVACSMLAGYLAAAQSLTDTETV
ncbi:M20 family metallopeptidase [Nocardia sp. NBC_00508]|uniref:M20 metallopeptidase family protein n=1 Tax=Nocardia sp. NBC_00508 TaxID=2975992 RepID=UPI002E80B618|nr:M20 family metallopeptidase [Nocardia sp. NBC_00508]WUD65298.1 M20 family metallopeptidase [Nocardia sp. NBC_00508]